MLPLRPIALAAALLLAQSSAQAAPAIWKVSDADSSVWLFGSVHMLPRDTKWRTARFDKVLSKAKKIFFETDIGPEAQAAITMRTFELGFNRDGRLLSDIIGPELTDRLRDAAHQYNVPMPALLTMQPWMAAMTLSMGGISEGQFDPLFGVEVVVEAELEADRKAFLETADQQLDFLASGSLEEQIAMLEATLDTMDVMGQDLEAMVEHWVAGEPEALSEMFVTQTGGYDPATMERLIDLRNADWAAKIDDMLANNESNFLIVGAAHLAGEMSVIRMLEDLGHTSERLQ